MRARDLLAAAPALLVAFALPTGAQDPPPELQAQVFRVEAEVVMLDLVVRDRKGRTVRDLRPEELQAWSSTSSAPTAGRSRARRPSTSWTSPTVPTCSSPSSR